MLCTLSGIVTVFKFSHSANAPLPMLSTPSGIVTLVKLQPQNAVSPILETPSGIVMVFKPSHPDNNPSLMLVILLGNVISVKPTQALKAYLRY